MQASSEVRLGLAVEEHIDLQSLREGHAPHRRQLDDLVARFVLGVRPPLRIGVRLHQHRVREDLGNHEVAHAHPECGRQAIEVVTRGLLGTVLQALNTLRVKAGAPGQLGPRHAQSVAVEGEQRSEGTLRIGEVEGKPGSELRAERRDLLAGLTAQLVAIGQREDDAELAIVVSARGERVRHERRDVHRVAGLHHRDLLRAVGAAVVEVHRVQRST